MAAGYNSQRNDLNVEFVCPKPEAMPQVVVSLGFQCVDSYLDGASTACKAFNLLIAAIPLRTRITYSI